MNYLLNAYYVEECSRFKCNDMYRFFPPVHNFLKDLLRSSITVHGGLSNEFADVLCATLFLFKSLGSW